MKINLSLIIMLCSIHVAFSQVEYGIASYYSDKFQNKKTASGEPYDRALLTAAHRTLPFGTKIKVTNLKNQKSVVVKVNDRGPFVKGYIVDLSRKAAQVVDLERDGIVKVKLEVLDKAVPAKPKPTPSSKPVPRPKEASPKVVVKPKPVKKPSPSPQKPPALVDSNHNLFKVQVVEQPKEAFGVQLGIYSKYENMLKHVAELQDKWFKNVLISIHKRKDGSSVYKVILGPLPSRALAQTYLTNVKAKGMKGYIIDLSELK